MATLVLSTVGTALAGPIGGLLGSLVGQSIDQQLLGGGARKGPRLGDLSVQTSAYGTPIPRIYGTMRVAGTIVWATELKEDSELQGDGKSQPETVVYTYSTSFAVALSCRRAVQVKRIWADGKLIRGMAGDLKVQGKFRFYPGDEKQAVDPLIGSIEGLGAAPAYRGLALAVFEDLQLGSFGNRIPSLTFELVADEGADIAIGELLTDGSSGFIQCTDPRPVQGYAAHGQDVAAAVAPIIEAFAVELYDDGDVLRSPSVAERQPNEKDLGAHSTINGSALLEREQLPASSLPSSVTLTYYDLARDFQTGQARASSLAPSRVGRAITLPCVLDAGIAKTAAENLLLRAWALRERLTIRLPLRYMDVRPGTVFRLPDVPGTWVAQEIEIEAFVVSVTLRSTWAHPGTRSADPGRSTPQPDIVAAPTRLALFDLPDPQTTEPTLALVAASPSGAWKQVPIEIEFGGAVSAGRTATGECIMGSAISALGSGQPALLDLVNSVDIQLANRDHWLQSRDDTALAMGANLAILGDELIQFGSAEPIADGRFRLSRLLRGRRGSEWAIADHSSGEAFALLDPRTIKPIALPVEMVGGNVVVTARGPGDAMDAPSVSRAANGEAMRPLSPAHLRAIFQADGSLLVAWVPRSRLAWAWLDQLDAPPDSSVQGYRLRIAGPGASIERDSSEEQMVVTAFDMGSLGTGTLTLEVRQIGTLALSRPATIAINI